MSGLLKGKVHLILPVTKDRLFSLLEKRYKLWSCQNVCEALIYLLNNIYIRFGTKLYRQIVGIPMGTKCALVADLFLFCYERDFMTSLSDVKQAAIIEAFKSTSRYLDDLLSIDNPYFEGMVNRIYPPGVRFTKVFRTELGHKYILVECSVIALCLPVVSKLSLYKLVCYK